MKLRVDVRKDGRFNIQSISYVELLNYYRKWYPNTKKIVPKRFLFNKESAKIWYLDDGFLHRNRAINFCTDGFNKESVDILIKKLESLGFKPKISIIKKWKKNNRKIRIRLNSIDSEKFLELIGFCSVKCYKYKWNKYNIKKFVK